MEGEQAFGVDLRPAIGIDGPIIACGKSGKEKALMVMDSSGNPVAKILQPELESNPNAIAQALVKARGFNQKILNFQQGGASGLVNDLRQKAISLVTKLIQDVVFDKKGDPATAVDPNDQLFKHIKNLRCQKIFYKHKRIFQKRCFRRHRHII